MQRSLSLRTPSGNLYGQLMQPEIARGLIFLVRCHHVAVDHVIAGHLFEQGYAVLGMDLLSARESQFADATQNVPRLAERLLDIIDNCRTDASLANLPVGLLALGDATPAAIRVAARRDSLVRGLTCYGGLPDRAGKQALNLLQAPLLMLFDPEDENGPLSASHALPHLDCRKQITTLNRSDDLISPVLSWFNPLFPCVVREI